MWRRSTIVLGVLVFTLSGCGAFIAWQNGAFTPESTFPAPPIRACALLDGTPARDLAEGLSEDRADDWRPFFLSPVDRKSNCGWSRGLFSNGRTFTYLSVEVDWWAKRSTSSGDENARESFARLKSDHQRAPWRLTELAGVGDEAFVAVRPVMWEQGPGQYAIAVRFRRGNVIVEINAGSKDDKDIGQAERLVVDLTRQIAPRLG